MKIEERQEKRRRVVYCVVPRELAGKLHDSLRRHFLDDASLEVVVERRADERRTAPERRAATAPPGPDASERRRIRNVEGRRVADRRAPAVEVERPLLPRRVRRYADRLVYLERLEPPTEQAEDIDTARLVMRIQAGERELFADLYMRYFDRVYRYLRVVFDEHEAEDATQQVFTRLLDALPRYERRRQPFRAWLFMVVRNLAINEAHKHGRLDVVAPAELDRRREPEPVEDDEDLAALDWISDRELMLFIDRLPLAQRQVLLLRYAMDLSNRDVAAILERSPDEVKVLHYRAVGFLRARLTAIGRGPRDRNRTAHGRRFKQAEVLRHRRFALARGGTRRLTTHIR